MWPVAVLCFSLPDIARSGDVLSGLYCGSKVGRRQANARLRDIACVTGQTKLDKCYILCYTCIIMVMERNTQDRITLAALEVFLAQGIKKTTVDEVASQAGVTRVTVYRYLGGKKQLVRAAFMRIISSFQDVQDELDRHPSQDIKAYLDCMVQGLAALPKGDLPTRMDELGRLYPDVLGEFHEARLAAIGGIFDRLFETAEGQGLLRENLNRAVTQAYFMDAVVKVMESPSLISLDLAPTEIFATVKTIFLHGILK